MLRLACLTVRGPSCLYVMKLSISSSCRHRHWPRQFSAKLLPGPFEDFTAVKKKFVILGKDFERDRSVVPPGLQGAQRRLEFEIAGAQRQMKVRKAAFIIVNVDVLDAPAVRPNNIRSRV